MNPLPKPPLVVGWVYQAGIVIIAITLYAHYGPGAVYFGMLVYMLITLFLAMFRD